MYFSLIVRSSRQPFLCISMGKTWPSDFSTTSEKWSVSRLLDHLWTSNSKLQPLWKNNNELCPGKVSKIGLNVGPIGFCFCFFAVVVTVCINLTTCTSLLYCQFWQINMYMYYFHTYTIIQSVLEILYSLRGQKKVEVSCYGNNKYPGKAIIQAHLKLQYQWQYQIPCYVPVE